MSKAAAALMKQTQCGSATTTAKSSPSPLSFLHKVQRRDAAALSHPFCEVFCQRDFQVS